MARWQPMSDKNRHDPIVSSLEGHVLVVSKQNGKAALTRDRLIPVVRVEHPVWHMVKRSDYKIFFSS